MIVTTDDVVDTAIRVAPALPPICRELALPARSPVNGSLARGPIGGQAGPAVRARPPATHSVPVSLCTPTQNAQPEAHRTHSGVTVAMASFVVTATPPRP